MTWMPSLANGRSIAAVMVIVLFALVAPAHVAGQAPPTGSLWVTYVNVTPTTTDTSNQIDIVFRVVYFTCDPYLGTISKPADGIKTATFLMVSVETQQSNRYPDTPVYPTGNPGEYRADIPIVTEDPTGKVWVYVEGNSLNSAIQGGALLGPPGNTASEQTYDNSDMSLIQIGQPASPSPLAKLFQGNELLLMLLALIVLLLLAISLLARRRGKPSPKP